MMLYLTNILMVGIHLSESWSILYQRQVLLAFLTLVAIFLTYIAVKPKYTHCLKLRAAAHTLNSTLFFAYIWLVFFYFRNVYPNYRDSRHPDLK